MKKYIDEIIKQLDVVSEKPMIFLGAELEGIFHFMDGYLFGILPLIKLPFDYRVFLEKSIKEHGIKITPSLENELKQKGLSNKEIVQVVISIHKKMWLEILDKLDDMNIE